MRKRLNCFLAFLAFTQLHAQVGIGTSTPNSSAQLEIASFSKGLLIPRMTATQRTAILTPATGLLVYQTDPPAGFYYHNGTVWVQLGVNTGWSLTGNAGTTASNFIGTTDGQPLYFKVWDKPAGHILPAGDNTAFGLTALKNSTGKNNTAIGTSALEYNSTGTSNTAIGESALRMNTLGSFNTANGLSALYTNTSGKYNTAMGFYALFYNATTTGNTAVGSEALYSNKADGNTGIGYNALYSNANGTLNTALGYQALFSNTNRGQNTAVGSAALKSNTLGTASTAVGANALFTNIDGANNTALGALADVATGSLTNATAIGYGAIADASNKVRIGNADVSSIGGQVGWTTFSDGRFKEDVKEDVPGLAFIKALRPVTYTVNKNQLASYYRKDNSTRMEHALATLQKTTRRETGFIAQEVEKAAKALGYNFSGVDAPSNDSALYGIRYSEFVMPLVKAVQEQQELIEALQKENGSYKEQLKSLQERLEKLEKLINK